MICLVTEQKDRELEEEKIKVALKRCGYPEWSFKQVKSKMENKHVKKSTNNTGKEKTKGFVVIPYLERLTDKPPKSSASTVSPLRLDLIPP